MASKPEVNVVFNFYQTLTPSPTKSSWMEGWQKMGTYVGTLDHYLCTLLHVNTDKDGKIDLTLVAAPHDAGIK